MMYVRKRILRNLWPFQFYFESIEDNWGNGEISIGFYRKNMRLSQTERKCGYHLTIRLWTCSFGITYKLPV